MEAVGEALLSSFVQLLVSKLKFPSDLLKYARQEQVHWELKKWEETLTEMLGLLDVAEHKQINDPSVKAWLERLRDLAYDMEDILDEFGYEALRRKVMAEADGEASTSKVRKLIPTCCTTFTPVKATMRNVKMGSKITEITRRLEDISAQKAGLGFKCLDKVEIITQSSWERQRVTSCEVYVPWVKGRDADKQIIIEMLLKDEPAATNVSVVSIVAMGGMGKTTLAKLVYYDTAEPIANHFALKAWVSVSIDFDIVGVTKKLLNSLISQSSNSEDFHEIQRQLKEALRGKRFLIVLDDLWGDMRDKWDDLRSPFLEAASGSKILVTTRDRDVAEWVGGPNNLHVLKPLSDDDCWSVFQIHAFEHINIHEHPNLESIGRKIVEKCGGLPLAAKALGGLLRAERREREWERVLDSKIWDLRDKRIIPALRLSYIHLPSPLKRCFAYCAIFPQDYEFMKEELIPLWMAEGLIEESKDTRRKEDLGDKYFCELFSRSFFQSSSSNGSLFVMHDLLNDLAKYVAGYTCLHLDDELKNNLQRLNPESTRHSSFICDFNFNDTLKKFEKFERFHKKEHLRTFIAIPRQRFVYGGCITNKVLQDLIPRLGYLRVLSLSGSQINEIPNEFGNLKLLRYLNLSKTDIKYLPDLIGGFYNLQTLILSNCDRLTRLPISIGHLINLRHLDVSGDRNLREMPSQIGQLKDLQVLSNFMVGKNKGLNIKELREMSNLRGELHISELENVLNVQDVRVARLKLKDNLERLTLAWSFDSDGSRNGMDQMNVLHHLEPQSNLNELNIYSYGGPEFPDWIRNGSFSKMAVLSLKDCKKCTSLPCLGQLPSLKRLWIQGMDGVKNVGSEFYGETCLSAEKLFPSLESLWFVNMSEWEYWEDWSSSIDSSFPCLRTLTIYNCRKLIKKIPTYVPLLTRLYVDNCPKLESTLLRLPSLKEIEVTKCNEAVLRNGTELTSVTSLTELTVSGILGLIKLQQGFVRSLSGLQALKFSRCEELTCLWEDGFESESLHCHQLVSLGCNLRSLKINKCDKLERLPNGWQSLTCLEELEIMDCPKLVSFPDVGFPPKLRSLTFENCEGLKCLPDGMMRNSNTSCNSCVLESLEIKQCSSLVSFPKGQLPTTLKKLTIQRCENLKSLPEGMMHCNSIATTNTMDTCALEFLSIEGCPSLIGFPKGRLPTTLKELYIMTCERLESLPEGITHHDSTNAAALHILRISSCSSLTSFPRGKFPSTLEQLWIQDCEQLESLSEEMLHPTNNSLQSLHIRGYPNLKALPDCLNTLTYLRIEDFKNLELLLPRIKNLTRLTELSIRNCENIKTPLSQWGLSGLTSLKDLSIEGMFPDATSFSNDPRLILLPTTLTSLSISRFQNLESLTSLSLQTLTSLERLEIDNCPKLRSILPREGLLPDTLSELHMWRCPHLQQRYSKEKGVDWPKIAHIPCVDIRLNHL
ncbi:putative disease resistance protein At3g14460 [Vitis riparia]|uniref:putative disease resistance protein At3g14460 n=1 Tax=Vitis riparia TaxID=96939 RepID=UPI00155A439F|nr:putative disease resistance protein At3g14460 [Vitis riparia]XP_034702854.1 putative disease resistance protein At3g14460 [Vitis riparia]XP_034702855.1 putative disease resistance protein At3g14460 [Vitis riparia]XP_034702856.1 putative disease resistance protein At3g14460 [Vitis riparia]XP_034702857.1 putative disease resistance protein At3g14460 [Vitis riparia]XP_034702858.1 putative disease resistance protein At3g14460 [Vitis riparia]XP_034702859.1 putative disease resistance protein At